MNHSCELCNPGRQLSMTEIAQHIAMVAYDHGIDLACFIGNGHLWSPKNDFKPMTKVEISNYTVIAGLVVKFNNLVDDIDVLNK